MHENMSLRQSREHNACIHLQGYGNISLDQLLNIHIHAMFKKQTIEKLLER